MPSNLRLLLFGLVIGALSVLYPRIPAYLPPVLLPYVPFLSRPSLSPESNAWTGYQRYQAKHPVAKNHDPFDVNEPIDERLRRLGSKDGDKQREKMEAKERKALEGRTETAGQENRVHDAFPVYFVDERQDATWALLSAELSKIVRPKMVLLISPLPSSENALTVSSSPLSQPIIVSLAYEGIVAHTRSSPPSTAASKRVAALQKSLASRKVDVLQIGLPQSWDPEYLAKVGRGLHKLRNKDVVLVGTGRWEKNTVPREALHDALVAHTAHPREVALEKLPGVPAALVAITGSADEGEGESLDGGKGLSWRFGHVPLRKV